jgi:hypothetical protein
MAIPLIGAAAAGVAARGVIKKLATRVVAGITGAGAKQVAPVYRNMEVPKAPPGSKPFNPNTPPKVPTSTPKKQPNVAERRDGAIGNQNPPVVKTSTPKKNPTKNKGSFSGDMARYNWTGN